MDHRNRPSWIAAALFSVSAAFLPAAPPNDNFASRTVLSGESGRVTGTNLGATPEWDDPEFIAWGLGGASVWYRWTAPRAGLAIIDTIGSEFDTLLGVYTGTSLAGLRLVVDDDESWLDFTSCVFFTAAAGTQYQILVDGYEGDQGRIVLNWRMPAPTCSAPAVPRNPSPSAGATGVRLDSRLEWNGTGGGGTIYGTDDRLDIYQVTDPDILDAWDSTVAFVDWSDLTPMGDGTYRLPSTTLAVNDLVCTSERFANQPNPAWCSGFLVGEDLVASAGHCLGTTEDCEEVAFIFGFKMTGASTPVLRIPEDQIYRFKELVMKRYEEHGADWSLIRLDRKVPDHRPLEIRRTGKIADRANVLIIGHPSGLPAKVAGGARVMDNTPLEYFTASLDSFGGNSGSAVFDAATLLVEGLLVRGNEDYDDVGACYRVHRCTETTCDGEDVTRATEFVPFLPVDATVTYEVHFGPCGSMVKLGDFAETSCAAPDLLPGTEYCWKVIAVSSCGVAEGAEWRFVTASAPQFLFRRADANGDGLADLSDAVWTLQYLFLGGPLDCLEAGDADDTGDLSISDPIFLLNALFLGGSPIPPPSPDCGADPTPDDLGCGRDCR